MKGCDLCALIIECFKEYGSVDAIAADPYSRFKRTWLGRDCDINSSMYDEAKDLDMSDVKVCINADHLGASDTIANVRVFDIVMVQVGDSRSWNSELTSEEDRTLPALSLTLSARRGMSTGFYLLPRQSVRRFTRAKNLRTSSHDSQTNMDGDKFLTKPFSDFPETHRYRYPARRRMY